MRCLEIFSGAGGLAKGLELAGFEHAAFVEWNRHAAATLAANFGPERVFAGDIRNFDFSSLGSVDVVAGGPPCQPFSLGGKHRAHHDERDMFPHAIKAIEALTPKAFVFENVKGLLRPSFADYFQYILMCLSYPDCAAPDMEWRDHLQLLRKIATSQYDGLCYRVSHQLLDAADYGTPQRRERVVIVGVRADLAGEWRFPEPDHGAEQLLREQCMTGDYWRRHGIAAVGRDAPSALLAATLRDAVLFSADRKPWRTVRDALVGLPDPRSDHAIADHIFRDGARSYPGHTGSDIDWPAKTIKAGGHGVPGGENMIRFRDGTLRYFTVREAKRLQTFPDDFVITGPWGEALRQIGNAVPVVLAQKIGLALRKLLDRQSAADGWGAIEETQKIAMQPGAVERITQASGFKPLNDLSVAGLAALIGVD